VWPAAASGVTDAYGGGDFMSIWFIVAVFVDLTLCFLGSVHVSTGVGGGERRDGVAHIESNAVC
jgi:hypothetical protein